MRTLRRRGAPAIDLLEEVGRVFGYDRVPAEPPMAAVALIPRLPRSDRIDRVRRVLSGECGLDEVMTYSFDSRSMLARLGYEPADPLPLRNPISADLATLRTDLAPSMLGVLERNATRFADFGTFEVARVFRATHAEDGVPVQGYRLSAAWYRKGAKSRGDASALFRQAKGALEHLFPRLGVGAASLRDAWTGEVRPWMLPRATVSIVATNTADSVLRLPAPSTAMAVRS
jgi:phenylalanyl-tRNA synthetase beta chain